MQIRFSKMHGLGNDFVVIDTLSQATTLGPEQIRLLADRHLGVGCDQVLLIAAAEDPDNDFRYRIFNADGGEAEQCGNGARCFAWYVRHRGLTDKDTLRLETKAGVIRTEIVDGNLVTVDMGTPSFVPAEIPFDADHGAERYALDVEGDTVEISVVSMGNPHAVVLVDDVTRADVAGLGPKIEKHRRFPRHTNVEFMEIEDEAHIRLRVHERGAGETLACGSGACAAAVAGQRLGLVAQRVAVELPGGSLFIEWPGGDGSVRMTGLATYVYEGIIEL